MFAKPKKVVCSDPVLSLAFLPSPSSLPAPSRSRSLECTESRTVQSQQNCTCKATQQHYENGIQMGLVGRTRPERPVAAALHVLAAAGANRMRHCTACAQYSLQR